MEEVLIMISSSRQVEVRAEGAKAVVPSRLEEEVKYKSLTILRSVNMGNRVFDMSKTTMQATPYILALLRMAGLKYKYITKNLTLEVYGINKP